MLAIFFQRTELFSLLLLFVTDDPQFISLLFDTLIQVETCLGVIVTSDSRCPASRQAGSQNLAVCFDSTLLHGADDL